MASGCVSAFFLAVQLSQPYLAIGHSSAFNSLTFVEIGMLWLVHIFHIFCPYFPYFPRSPALYLTWCGILSYTHRLLWSQNQGMGTYSTVPFVHSKWVCDTLFRRSPLPWSCRYWWVGCICGWLGLDYPPTPVFLPSKSPTGRCHQRSEDSWLFALQFVVHLEIHPESPSSPSQLACWTSTEKGHNLVGRLS